MKADPWAPRDDETDAQYRARYRPYCDAMCARSETIGFRRGAWVYVMQLAGVDPGADLTAADQRRPIVVAISPTSRSTCCNSRP